MKSSLIIFSCLVLGCKDSSVKRNTSDLNHEMKRVNCVERIFEKDSVLGNIRNHASENISLSEAIINYTRALESLDFTSCPEKFKSAFGEHIEAWKGVAEISNKYPLLRGELHDVFAELEKSEDSIAFKFLVKQVWDTWKTVDESVKTLNQ